jgi:hypothetical protein
VASPALSRLLVYPRTDFFTELWLLGSNNMAEDYPYNITQGQSYNVSLGIGNQFGYMAYYLVEVKFRNSTQSEPSSFGPPSNQTPSSLPSLYNATAFVADQATWELPITFSFGFKYDQALSRVEFTDIVFNNVVLSLTNYVSAWNSTRRDFFGNLFFELWIYNRTTSVFQYHQRFVSLVLNMTV